MANAVSAKSAQEFVPIQEIREGVAILKDGALRMILMASSLNFALKSADEQEAIILQYQNFLNSLDFTVQFFIQSRKLNINPYLDTLREAEKNQVNELLKIQTREYIEFIKNFVEASNIVTKAFYAVVPYQPPVFTSAKEAAGTIMGIFKKKDESPVGLSDEKFEEYKTQLFQRVDTVAQGLTRSGVRVAPLNTEELIELYYSLFNPGELEKGKAPEVG
ncbi:hypothetical protein A2757_03445 [Candidatus Giovannonibacteria bacterium RIFCSPHIGHO2_01_FULL_48_47]|nr:MAG: hypothetical protein A2757_03445 [Candidatus Giovannonibacteria bacterium RIFCSPHIGHO2_01_FULL_48_47]OGF68740.1 MAG: hypothetical protein A3D61_01460 [Candidatus Giovannonibacteria bacterium RIFCSPHIGHO2_02_FULL_48_15]OGF89888.1 MAG: hypothetical protein A3B26_00440 [Candidatus Giovannonibacteria bacterium RIFCSPLOWO2_01_FULL_48_47]OGF95390.1 MAG: hypothetical protein A2433_02890 [Candidatus Giovannonibacteria bacterium RIFOXYC1_FULL_48_8]OGF96327.1 MAG: hypothetical protein A2613_02080